MKTILKTSIIIWLLLAGGAALAQSSIDSVLHSVEKNNGTLKALRQNLQAEILDNKTGIYLPNPEVEFNYLWGTPGQIGNRTDFSVSQSFDIPTVTGMRSRAANAKNKRSEWQYKADRMTVLLEAKQYCIDLIYFNALKKELSQRMEHAGTIAAAYGKRLKNGDISRLEYNKSQLNLSALQGEIMRLDIERAAILSQLRRLNGGIEVALNEDEFAEAALPLLFEDWYRQAAEKNPVLAYVRQEVEVHKQEVSLNKALRLPTFSAGYMSEKVVGEHFRGVTFGISIPLWENKNRIKQSKAAVQAAELREADSRQQFYSRLKGQYERALALQAAVQTYREALDKTDNAALLKKALDAGEISLLDYMVEIGLYYDMLNQLLEAKRDYHKALADLASVEL
ncbi:MAG TPA: transporter [Porphyromonadaceae bacterium]|nr:transporter [Porphyromonadaceae bacterium]